MTRKEFAVIDFGSSKIVLLVGFKSKDGVHILTKCEAKYDGFMEGEFLNEEKLSEIVSQLVIEAEKSTSKRITKLFIGVPDEFLVSSMMEEELHFKKPTRIKEKHLQWFLENVDLSFIPETHEVIHIAPISYSLDQKKVVLDITKDVASKIVAYLSIITAEKKFLELMSHVMKSVGIAEIEYLPTCLATSSALVDKEDQKKGAILIDVGNVTTSVCAVLNHCVVQLMTFTSGGGFISMDLMNMLKIGYFEAEQLKRKTVLSIEPTKDDYYEIYKDNKLVKYYSQTVNDIVKARVESIATYIRHCMDQFSVDITSETNVYLTGGGLGYLVGATEILSQILDKKVKLVCPKELQYFRPDYASSMALLDMVIDIAE